MRATSKDSQGRKLKARALGISTLPAQAVAKANGGEDVNFMHYITSRNDNSL